MEIILKLIRNNIYTNNTKFQNKMFIILFLMIILIFTPLSSSSLVQIQPTKFTQDIFSIDLDCNHTNGNIKSFADICCGPIPIYHVVDGVDITKQYQDIGIEFIRTHDFFGPTDISTIFPDWDANPILETSYRNAHGARVTKSGRCVGRGARSSTHDQQGH